VAFVFADYKEKGILKRLLATPMKPQQFVTAQVITRLIVALAQSAILLAVGVWLLHTHVYGSLWLVALIAIVGSVMFLGLGFTISGLANTVDSVPAIANLI
ncbi:MAG: ABC transporter permease, partial [Patescibacteria group bacterium]